MNKWELINSWEKLLKELKEYTGSKLLSNAQFEYTMGRIAQLEDCIYLLKNKLSE